MLIEVLAPFVCLESSADQFYCVTSISSVICERVNVLIHFLDNMHNILYLYHISPTVAFSSKLKILKFFSHVTGKVFQPCDN